MNSCDLLYEINALLIGIRKIEKILMGHRQRISPGEELPGGVKPCQPGAVRKNEAIGNKNQNNNMRV